MLEIKHLIEQEIKAFWFITCAFTDQSAEFGAKEDINVIEDELHYH